MLLSIYRIFILTVSVVLAQSSDSLLGPPQTNGTWKAGHVAVYVDPHVIIYGGTDSDNPTTPVHGSTSLWAWDSRNGSWYQPQAQTMATMLPQVFFGATSLPSSGQLLAIASNTTQGGSAGMLQKLDTNSWTWSFPSLSVDPPARSTGFSTLRVNNTIYTYGGVAVDANGMPMSNAVLNSLNLMDANTFQWTTGSNGAGITDHSTCYLPACNCLVTFGGTATGNPNDATQNVHIYDLARKGWSLQVSVGSVNGAMPGARRLHTATCLKDKMIVFGGGTGQPYDSDVWVLDATRYPTLTWERKDMANKSNGPNSRMGHSAVLDEKKEKIYIYGGWGVSANHDTAMYVLDPVAWSWTRVTTTGYSPDGQPSDPNPPSPSSQTGHKSNQAGIIAGSVIGGLAALGAALGAFFFIRRKRRQNNNNDDSVVEKVDNYDDHYGYDNYYYNEQRHSSGKMHANDYVSNDSNTLLPYPYKRTSKAWTNHSRDSFGRPAEIGDTGRVRSATLEMIPGPRHPNPNDARASKDSFRVSKCLLMPPPLLDDNAQGQVPNEVTHQKPNEFSVPAAKFAAQHNPEVSVKHYTTTSPTSPTATDAGAPLSCSMEVLRSIKTNDSALVAGPRTTRVFHTASSSSPTLEVEERPEDEDKWTIPDSMSLNVSPPTAIQYIPANKQFSIATTATESASGTTWNQKGTKSAVPLTHHQYPSSNVSVPMARPVTPHTNDVHELPTNGYPPGHPNDVSLYESVSPLEMLATLGRSSGIAASSSEHSEQHSSVYEDRHVSPNMTRSTTTKESSVTSSQDASDSTTRSRLAAVAPLISMMPRLYKMDTLRAPILGPTNKILFVYKLSSSTNTDEPSSPGSKAVIKSFGRREAWERECRTLTKLNSRYVVKLLEVLTIEDESMRGHQPSSNGRASYKQGDDDQHIHYVTAMEQLDETLATVLRRARHEPEAWTDHVKRSIARNIVECLVWCHSQYIAFCDLKPSNIMHNVGQPWKLIDFEACRTIGEECVGVITPRYCPPEVARATTYGLEGANGVVATASVDLWALGCVIYELETKQPLFANNIKDETILHFISHPAPSTPILNNGLRWNDAMELEIPHLERQIPNTLTRRLIQTLLSRDPSDRGSAHQLLDHPYFQV
ncbi:uncharacterized protein BYT42DRAFT_640558 [Radiomyces spectabilis]|uniref:uncharacterized protein n=1 Tax=Radiomyces spectabilis TaxID=64574 RepID=UPI00221EC6C2|nr:uncharacterized protein BYT42DRAFT_640558 [Radiomyces spectabilis]KAI8393378.1 hypothetical protein BYT42DRAFT_640558 [Radiomyces spectabilis]